MLLVNLYQTMNLLFRKPEPLSQFIYEDPRGSCACVCVCPRTKGLCGSAQVSRKKQVNPGLKSYVMGDTDPLLQGESCLADGERGQSVGL